MVRECDDMTVGIGLLDRRMAVRLSEGDHAASGPGYIRVLSEGDHAASRP